MNAVLHSLRVYARNLLLNLFVLQMNQPKLVQHVAVALLCTANLVDINVYVNVLLLLLAVVYKQLVENYLVRRFISFTVFFSVIAFRFFSLQTILCIVVYQLLCDIDAYDKTRKQRQQQDARFLSEYMNYISRGDDDDDECKILLDDSDDYDDSDSD